MTRLAYVAFTLAFVVIGFSSPASAHASDSDPVRVWNEAALESVRSKRASDAETARLLAMVNVAIYDAVNALDESCGRPQGNHEDKGDGKEDRAFALVAPSRVPRDANPAAAAAAAAHAVLVAVYPDQAVRFDALLAVEMGKLGRGRSRGDKTIDAGRGYGARVGAEVVARRASDGSTPYETQPPTPGVGRFTLPWGGVQFRNLRPFAIKNPADYVSAGPPAVDSLDYAAALAEVKLLGAVGIADSDKLAIYQYWSLGAGSVQPPGEWVKIALTVTSPRALELAEKARLFALLTMAMADTVAPTYTTKFLYQHWRPTSAIREAEYDANPHTDSDVRWAARAGGQGTSPEHTSGHSAFSAAAAGVLAGFFCQDAIAFTHVSDSAPGLAPRSFSSFSAAAAEAGRSRVFGGVHFEFSNQAGLEAGRGIAAEVLGKMLLRKRGRTHIGSCPL
jgi:PAP2 superfamily